MFQVGDQVVYGIHGVCRILREEERSVDRKKIEYFALEPLDQKVAQYFVPSENPGALAKLRHLISREDLDSLLASNVITEPPAKSMPFLIPLSSSKIPPYSKPASYNSLNFFPFKDVSST